ncbi:MAG: hypothetical protein FP816_18925 [Desulfobacteraceae bacterium]|nr:hypothetical protein [Desulfobacteraceae bacterium]
MEDKYLILSGKKQRAVLALISEPTIQAAAAATGIGETTLYRWLHDKEFQKAFYAARREIIGQSITRLQQASGKAVTTLVEIMSDQDKPASTRVTAAKTVLEMAFKSIELEGLEIRLTAIEDRLRQVFQWSG